VSIHPVVLADLKLSQARATLDLERTRARREALPNSTYSHTAAMRLHKLEKQQAAVKGSWDLVIAATEDDFEVDERTVPGE
jgi:hypothetical protein